MSSSTDTDAKQVTMFKQEIKDFDVIYKDNVDKYKTKNNQLNNIVKSNLYNNIFLYCYYSSINYNMFMYYIYK